MTTKPLKTLLAVRYLAGENVFKQMMEAADEANTYIKSAEEAWNGVARSLAQKHYVCVVHTGGPHPQRQDCSYGYK